MASSFVGPEDQAAVKTLHTWTTATSNSGTTETTLATYTLPGGTLSADGQVIRVHVGVSFAANTNTKVVTVYFGAASLALNNVTTAPNGVDGIADFWIVRTGAAAQQFQRASQVSSIQQSVNGGSQAASEALSSNVLVKVTGTGAASSDITFRSGWVEFLPAGGLN